MNRRPISLLLDHLRRFLRSNLQIALLSLNSRDDEQVRGDCRTIRKELLLQSTGLKQVPCVLSSGCLAGCIISDGYLPSYFQ